MDGDSSQTTIDPNSDYVDRQCGSNLTSLWLDVVVVVDNSHGMTRAGLTQVAANIHTVFGYGTQIGVQTDEPRTTRVALITYSDKATIVADLDTYQSYEDLTNGLFGSLNTISSTDESYLASGLAAAEQVFQDGSVTGTRSQYQKVVIIYASSYKGTGELNPLPVADRLKTSGTYIVTVAFGQNHDGALLKDLGLIASPNYEYSNTDRDVVGELQGAMLQINCFCPNGWTQYRSAYSYIGSYRFGVCMSTSVLAAGWSSAKFSCRLQWDNAYLVNEYDLNKHNYIIDMLQNNTDFQQPYTYHIGLSYSKGNWYWERPPGEPQKQLQQWSYWSPGYPKTDSTLTGVTNFQTDGEEPTGWQNVNQQKSTQFYICEVAACDSDNYCATVDL